MKLYEKIKKDKEYEINIFNIPIIQYGKKQNDEMMEKYFDLFPSKGFSQNLFRCILFQTGNYKTVVLNRHGMGETYILANLFKYLPLYKDKENLIIAGRREYISDIFEIFCPEISAISIKCDEYLHFLKNDKYKYKNHNFILYLPITYFDNLYKKMEKDTSLYFVQQIAKYISITDSKIQFNQAIINSEHEKFLLKKFSKYFSLDNLIIVSPHALSSSPYYDNFWKALVNKLKNMGYCVFINSNIAKYYNSIQNNKLYSVKDIFYITRYAKAVIGLRSGLIDVLSSINTKFHILYTQNPYRKVLNPETYIKTHTLKKMPNVNNDNIFEYNTSYVTPGKILEEILRSL